MAPGRLSTTEQGSGVRVNGHPEFGLLDMPPFSYDTNHQVFSQARQSSDWGDLAELRTSMERLPTLVPDSSPELVHFPTEQIPK